MKSTSALLSGFRVWVRDEVSFGCSWLSMYISSTPCPTLVSSRPSQSRYSLTCLCSPEDRPGSIPTPRLPGRMVDCDPVTAYPHSANSSSARTTHDRPTFLPIRSMIRPPARPSAPRPLPCFSAPCVPHPPARFLLRRCPHRASSTARARLRSCAVIRTCVRRPFVP